MTYSIPEHIHVGSSLAGLRIVNGRGVIWPALVCVKHDATLDLAWISHSGVMPLSKVRHFCEIPKGALKDLDAFWCEPADVDSMISTFNDVWARQQNREREASRIDAPRKERTDAERLDFLEKAARRSQTGISFDYIPSVEGAPSGFRFMRRFFVSDSAKTLRQAIDLTMPLFNDDGTLRS